MISTITHLTLSMLLPFTAGYLCLQFLFRKHALPISLKIALSYGLGLGILAIWMLCLYMCQQPFSLFVIRTPLLIIIIFVFFLNLKQGIYVCKARTNQHNQTQKTISKPWLLRVIHVVFIAILVLYIAQNVYYVFWRSLTIPITSWDAIATVAFKAKIFYFEPSPTPLKLLPHHPYPLLVPFVQSWIAFSLGYWNDILIKIIFPCAFLAYLTIHYKFLARFTNKTWALLGCAILVSSNFFMYHATISYRDFFIMYFNCTAILLLIHWNQNKANPFLTLAGLYAGFTTFTKLEGTGYLVIHTLMVIFLLWKNGTIPLRNKFKKFFIFTIPSYTICLTYHIYKISLGISGMSGRMNLAITKEHMIKLPVLISDFLSNFFLSGNWNIIWFLLLVSLLFHHKKIRHSIEIQLLSFPLLMFLFIYVFILAFTSTTMVNVSFGLLSRVILHFFPLSVLLIVLLNNPDFSCNQRNSSSSDSTIKSLSDK